MPLISSFLGTTDIAGHITEFTGDRIGSRFIQTQMETASLEELKGVFQEIAPYSTLQLIQDIYGNHVIQKLFEYGTQDQTDAMLGIMEKHVFQLACHSYASFVVRKVPVSNYWIITHLKPHIMACVKHPIGHEVIQSLLRNLAPEALSFASIFTTEALRLASHPFGSRVLQCCFENLPNRQRSPLIEEVLNRGHLRELFLTQFGILEEGYPEEECVVAQLRGRFLIMAKHKFASHICEKALLYYNSDASRALIDEILDSNSIRPNPTTFIVVDARSPDYVLQTALRIDLGQRKKLLIENVEGELKKRRNSSRAYMSLKQVLNDVVELSGT
ncbi:ARM repeat-containing protein [Favolaschia claudopus]|uniref:ARM repeat-containing protein n=1 Tax=Favolaschia claudopus TaxID=2862362 RepID=A0AAW0B427_9AGAR